MCKALAKAKQKALRLLASRGFAEKELQDRLVKAGYCDECIKQVISWLKDLKYIDDTRFALEWIRVRALRKGYGPIRLRQELLLKGVEEELIAQVMEECLLDEEMLISARVQVEKRMKSIVEIHKEKAYSKLYSFLHRKGFPNWIIVKTLEDSLGVFQLDNDKQKKYN